MIAGLPEHSGKLHLMESTEAFEVSLPLRCS